MHTLYRHVFAKHHKIDCVRQREGQREETHTRHTDGGGADDAQLRGARHRAYSVRYLDIPDRHATRRDAPPVHLSSEICANAQADADVDADTDVCGCRPERGGSASAP